MTHLHRRKGLLVPLFAGLIAILVATPASAHEEITPQTFPTGQPTYFTFSAANEKGVALTTVTLAAPSVLPFGATTREPPGWSVVRSDRSITWSGGTVAPDHYEQWGFEVEGADQPGNLAYHVTLGYSDGTTDAVEVDTRAVVPPTTTAPAASAALSAPAHRTTPVLSVIALVVALISAGLSASAVLSTRGNRGPATPKPDDPVRSAQDW